ncbi:MAG: hypothetical protein DMF66_16455 [Acidobacteria bacterium]|nr:MAG: hypothetical protein DMF66_16455 [Acidobacteriota bacterium]
MQLLFLSAPTEPGSAAFPRVLVVAERDSRLDIIESYAATEEAAYFTDAVVEVFVGAGARVTHYKVQDESGRAFHVASTRAELARDSSYDLTTVTLGARLSRHNIEVKLDSEGAACRVDGLYIVGDGQHTDTHSLIDHQRPNCTSRQNYKGIPTVASSSTRARTERTPSRATRISCSLRRRAWTPSRSLRFSTTT